MLPLFRSTQESKGVIGGKFFSTWAIMTFLVSAVLVIFGWFVLGALDPDIAGERRMARLWWIIQNRWILPVLLIPAFVMLIVILTTHSSRRILALLYSGLLILPLVPFALALLTYFQAVYTLE